MDVAIALIGGGLTAAALWKPIFGSLDEFTECIGYWFTPDAWSFLSGDYWEDFMAELKIALWLVPSIAVGFGLHHLVGQWV